MGSEIGYNLNTGEKIFEIRDCDVNKNSKYGTIFLEKYINNEYSESYSTIIDVNQLPENIKNMVIGSIKNDSWYEQVFISIDKEENYNSFYFAITDESEMTEDFVDFFKRIEEPSLSSVKFKFFKFNDDINSMEIYYGENRLPEKKDSDIVSVLCNYLNNSNKKESAKNLINIVNNLSTEKLISIFYRNKNGMDIAYVST